MINCSVKSHFKHSFPPYSLIKHSRLFTIQSFSCSSGSKESACTMGDLGSIPGLGRSPGEGKGYPLQHSGLKNSMDCIIHVVAKSRTGLSDFHFHFHSQYNVRESCLYMKDILHLQVCYATTIIIFKLQKDYEGVH